MQKTQTEIIEEIFESYPVASFNTIFELAGLERKTLSARLSAMRNTHNLTVHEHTKESNVYEYYGRKGVKRSKALRMLERCYHLIMAHSVCSFDTIQDTLEIESSDETQKLIKNTVRRYSNVLQKDYYLRRDSMSNMHAYTEDTDVIRCFYYTMATGKCSETDVVDTLSINANRVEDIFNAIQKDFHNCITIVKSIRLK